LANGQAEAAGADGFALNAFIRIGGDGQVILTMPYVEMGQSTYTSIPMLLAEELEVDLKQVRLEHAPPNEKLYGNPLLGGIQAIGNSNAIRAAWQPLRQAGATARTMLVATAARRWNVDPASCRAQGGEVLHAPAGRRIKYGELAADAAGMPVPETVALKRPEDFRLIGTPANRLDTPSKVNGTAVYGIDVRPSGVKIATLAQSPVFGGRVKNVDDAAAKAVKGVRQIVRLDDAVAVVADLDQQVALFLLLKVIYRDSADLALNFGAERRDVAADIGIVGGLPDAGATQTSQRVMNGATATLASNRIAIVTGMPPNRR